MHLNQSKQILPNYQLRAKDINKADSLPDPGPFRRTSSFLNPISYAFFPAASVAICAAYGVDFFEPLKPMEPLDDQDTAFPLTSEIVTIVLLKEPVYLNNSRKNMRDVAKRRNVRMQPKTKRR